MDDTICQKTKPSSRATHVIQGCDCHDSHKDHQMVWGHSLVWLMVHTFTQAFPFAFHLYDKKVETSKMDLAIEMLSLFKGKRARPMYVLMDSWYPSKELIEACLKQGFHVIAMLKTNRILDPKGIAIQTKSLARYIKPQAPASSRWVRSVTACIAMRGRSMASMTRWCCWLRRRISR
ncbi:hypothetical protein GS8_3094 [Geobacillus stearothermophilus]|uniref:Transposase IS4-like domain-containing protein n=1 Tax=Geobacillus stearothermophilus TaxID=1422 RepID=A0ABQ7HBJ6_GEOSE|nr:hypothetical protein GS8_3094 [Geobacillus stearothermophilus]